MQYRYDLDRDTRSLIEEWDIEQWVDVLRKLLSHQPVPYNIDFSEPLGRLRVLEINQLLQKYHIDNGMLVAAVYRLFHESLRNVHDQQWAYALVEIFDVIKPAVYFDRLVSLLSNSEYDKRFDARPPQGEFYLRYRLVNAIMVLDTDYRLLDILLSKLSHEQPPEYYQIMIRYFYTSHGKSYLRGFMQKTLEIKLSPIAHNFLVGGFREYVYTMKTFDMLYQWLSNDVLFYHKRRQRIPVNREKFIASTIAWINSDHDRLLSLDKFIPMMASLSPYNLAHEYEFSAAHLYALFRYDKSKLKNKYELCEFIGSQNPRLHISEIIFSLNTVRIWLPNCEEALEIELDSDDVRCAIENFEMGVENYRSYSRNKDDWDYLIVDEKQIDESKRQYFQ